MKNKITMLVLLMIVAVAIGVVMSKPVASDHHESTTWTQFERYQIIDLLKKIEKNTRE